jgi:hypothetical protein
MKIQNSLRSLLLLLMVVAAWPISATHGQKLSQEQRAQQVQQARRRVVLRVRTYAFVSPNTREKLTLKEAIERLNSADEKRLIEESRRVACRLHLPSSVRKAVGSWTDGAEHSTVTRTSTTEPTVRYAASWLGKFARQKAVLYFLESRAGSDRMYVLLLPRNRLDMAAITTELDADGIENRTLVPQTNRMLVYIVDLKDELKPKVLTAARRLRAQLSSQRGKGEFIGDDDRDKAQAVFEPEILKYEGTHPRVRRRCMKANRAWHGRLARVTRVVVNSRRAHDHAQDAPATLMSTPSPKRAGRKVDAIAFVIHGAFDVAKIAVEKDPRPVKMPGFFTTVLRQEKQLPARIMRYLTYPLARAAKAPVPGNTG